VPSSSGSTNSAGTLKFLKLQTGSVETSRNATPPSTTAHVTGLAAIAASRGQSIARASSPTNSGNSASPAPAGAGTPVKKL
jgi:hypothetical protein